MNIVNHFKTSLDEAICDMSGNNDMDGKNKDGAIRIDISEMSFFEKTVGFAGSFVALLFLLASLYVSLAAIALVVKGGINAYNYIFGGQYSVYAQMLKPLDYTAPSFYNDIEPGHLKIVSRRPGEFIVAWIGNDRGHVDLVTGNWVGNASRIAPGAIAHHPNVQYDGISVARGTLKLRSIVAVGDNSLFAKLDGGSIGSVVDINPGGVAVPNNNGKGK